MDALGELSSLSHSIYKTLIENTISGRGLWKRTSHKYSWFGKSNCINWIASFLFFSGTASSLLIPRVYLLVWYLLKQLAIVFIELHWTWKIILSGHVVSELNRENSMFDQMFFSCQFIITSLKFSFSFWAR